MDSSCLETVTSACTYTETNRPNGIHHKVKSYKVLQRHFMLQSSFFLQKHYYQPLWTLVGGGEKKVEDSIRPTESVIPPNSTWIKDGAAEFSPDNNSLLTKNGSEV